MSLCSPLSKNGTKAHITTQQSECYYTNAVFAQSESDLHLLREYHDITDTFGPVYTGNSAFKSNYTLSD